MKIHRRELLKSLNYSVSQFNLVLRRCGFYHQRYLTRDDLKQLLDCLSDCKNLVYKRKLFIFRLKEFLDGGVK